MQCSLLFDLNSSDCKALYRSIRQSNAWIYLPEISTSALFDTLPRLSSSRAVSPGKISLWDNAYIYLVDRVQSERFLLRFKMIRNRRQVSFLTKPPDGRSTYHD